MAMGNMGNQGNRVGSRWSRPAEGEI